MPVTLPFKRLPFVIGMVHFGPLAGRPTSPGLRRLLAKARADLRALIDGGVDGIMFENMYDQPHTERLDPARVREFSALIASLTPKLRVPWGISMLWNDYPHALRLARRYGGLWIRVPVFVDGVDTAYGRFLPPAADVLALRRRLKATKVALLVDVQVKHASMIKPRSLVASARASVNAGADGLIITGQWTGDPPRRSDITKVQRIKKSLPVLIGSGLTAINVQQYAKHIDGAIVGTTFKRGGAMKKSAHLMRSPWTQPISRPRVVAFMRALRSKSRG